MEKTRFIESTCEILKQLRERSPLVLCLTNSVVQPITANLLLAAGAAPVMLCDDREVAELVGCGATGAFLINLGTLSEVQAQTMRAAVEAAGTRVPWVLDPVAVGALSLRTRFADELLDRKPTLIRGNASEIMALAGFGASARGPESTCGSDAAVEAARKLAERSGSAVLVTGAVDYVTDGAEVFAFGNGNALATRVTGVGCSMGALAAACLAVAKTPLEAAAANALIMGIVGDIAAKTARGSGSFAVALIDALYNLSENDIRARARIL